jgi:Holliday junction resolvase-like predicted endonuclease
VENIVAPAVLRLFQERGIEIRHLYRRAVSDIPGARMEVDILAVNGDVAVVVEVKSRLTKEDVDDFCESLQRFKQAFPERVNHQLYGAVAAIELVKDIDRYAYRKGLFFIRQCGNSVELANDDGFQPRAW